MAVNRENTMKDVFVECLSQQISEYELLKSMYPDPGEIVLTDKHIIEEINDFLENKSDYIPNRLDFKLNLLVNDLKLELFINLPGSYPKEEPDICVRCNKLNRYNESKLNSELSNYIKENHMGEVCLYTAVSWLQEKIDNFIVNIQETVSVEDTDSQNKDDEFARLWIYSHHIYNKRKREEIVNRAKELKLTGFSLPGKPGVVCIEGYHSDCQEWWKDIKSMNWKKIMIRKTETFLSDEKSFRKFDNFEEIKLNMSDLSKYMNELGLNNVFNEFFGLSHEESL